MHIVDSNRGENITLWIVRVAFGSRKEITEAIDRATYSATCQHFVFNLEKVTFMDSMSLGLLVATYQKFRKTNRKVSLLSPNGMVKKRLRRGISKRSLVSMTVR